MKRRKSMRMLWALAGLPMLGLVTAVPGPGFAQARPVNPGAARTAADAAAIALPDEARPADRAAPLAAGKRGPRILSRNEAYNIGRSNEGRVGVRLGNDMSFPVDGN